MDSAAQAVAATGSLEDGGAGQGAGNSAQGGCHTHLAPTDATVSIFHLQGMNRQTNKIDSRKRPACSCR